MSRWPLLLGLLLALTSPATSADDYADRMHESALSAARQGDLDTATARLRQLMRRQPGVARYLHDYISVLQRAGRNDEALDLLSRVERAGAPAYVLESLGAAAAASGRDALASELYLGVLMRFPGRPESLQGLADAITLRTVARKTMPADVPAQLSPLTPADRAEVLQRAAAALESRANYYAALHLTLAALQAHPTHAAALAARVRLNARLGAAHLALQHAQATPGAVDPVQLDTLQRHVAAVDGRWASVLRTLPRHHIHGTALLDAAIGRSDALAARFLGSGQPMGESELKWLHDRMVLLGARDRATDVDALYRAFQRRGLELPVYAQAAVADAQLRLRRPRQAIALYEQVLRAQPDSVEARVGMYYALLEAEEHARAYAWVDAWVVDTAPAAGTPPSPSARATHWGARTLQARAREFSGEPAKAQFALDRLRAEAPANADVRAGLASVYRARGWPRRAWETWQIQLLHDPEDVEAYAESVGPLLDSQRFELAHSQLRQAQRRQPEALSVARAARAWHLHNRPELLLTANSGRSRDNSTPSGDRDHRVDAYLYSAPFGERYRAYLRAGYASGELSGGTTRYRRTGAGLEYRGPDLRLTGEWHTGWRHDGGAGLRLGARWWIDDIWNITFEGDTRTLEIPLQARAAGLEAKRVAIETEARLHDARAFAASLSVLDFSDGNNRQSALLSWREGWLRQPRYRLDSRADLYASRNSRTGTAYFNPRSDTSASVSLTGGWLTFRHYERALVQELTLSAGRYWQSDFAAGPLWGLEYAHRWELDERFYLRYALGRSLHPYDGQQSGRNFLSLDLDWRF